MCLHLLVVERDTLLPSDEVQRIELGEEIAGKFRHHH